MPGLPICAPMTPKEYNEIWNKYLKSDSPMLVSEHRRSYKESIEFKDEINKASRLTLFLISASRFEANKIKEKLKKKGIQIDIFHILWLKPFIIKKKYIESLKKTKIGLVVRLNYEICMYQNNISLN